MAFPTIGQPDWGPDLLDTLGVELNTDGTLKNVVRPTDLPHAPAYAPLDDWQGFNANGGAGSWNALTYAGWISGIDALLADAISEGDVVKADLGVASDTTSHVYSYTAGEGPVPVLIVGGIHGSETVSQYAAMRWFARFATSTEMQMRQMRNAFRVTWIPTLNAAEYRVGRVNDNGVDINRNFDLFWSRYDDGGGVGSPTYKGAAPFDQPEADMIKTLLDATPYRVVIDCHNYGNDGDTMGFGLPGHWILGARQLGLDAIANWEHTYGESIAWHFLSPVQTPPTLANYANYHMRHLNGRLDSGTMLIECSQNLAGSSSTNATAGAVAGYAGFIQTYLLAMIDNRFRATATPYSYTMYGRRISSPTQLESAIADGGTLISSTTAAAVRLDRLESNGVYSQSTDYEVPLLVAPATVTVQVSGTVRSMGNAVGRHAFDIAIDGTSESWETAYVTSSATTLEASVFAASATRYYDTLSNEDVPVVEVLARRVAGGNAELYTVNVVITVTPHTDAHMIPRLGGA